MTRKGLRVSSVNSSQQSLHITETLPQETCPYTPNADINCSFVPKPAAVLSCVVWGHSPLLGITPPSFLCPQQASVSTALPHVWAQNYAQQLWTFSISQNHSVSREARPRQSPTKSPICAVPLRHMEHVTSHKNDYCLRQLRLISWRLLATLKMLLMCFWSSRGAHLQLI